MIFLSGGTTLKGFGKAAGIPAATWSSGGALNTGRNRAYGSASGNDAALVFGGSVPPSTFKNETENYNGSSWTEVNNLNEGRRGGVGTGLSSTAALCN